MEEIKHDDIHNQQSIQIVRVKLMIFHFKYDQVNEHHMRQRERE